jgi:hypothetical protein
LYPYFSANFLEYSLRKKFGYSISCFIFFNITGKL